MLDILSTLTGSSYRREAAHEYAGACPWCGGDDRFRVFTDSGRYWCRKCDRKGDAIQYLREHEGMAFHQAQQWLADHGMAAQPAPQGARRQKPPQPAEWRRKALAEVKRAYALLASDAGAAARVYLLSRGLQPETWDAYRMGFLPDVGIGWDAERRTFTTTAPAIVMPWYRGSAVIAVRYRFLEPQNDRGEVIKAKGKYGSRFSTDRGTLLYGHQALDWDDDRSSQTVVLVEGELNAASIRQATGWHAFSYGSEGNTHLSEKQVAFLNGYARRIVWADRLQVAQKLQAQLPDAIALQSPDGRDANDLLRGNMLTELLEIVAERG